MVEPHGGVFFCVESTTRLALKDPSRVRRKESHRNEGKKENDGSFFMSDIKPRDIKRPTAESIEAAISALEPPLDVEADVLSDDTQTFVNLMFNNERLRLELVAVFNAIGCCPEDSDPTDWRGLAKAGHVNPNLMRKVTLLCNMFFWVGWHTRGAVEEAEQRKGMAE